MTYKIDEVLISTVISGEGNQCFTSAVQRRGREFSQAVIYDKEGITVAEDVYGDDFLQEEGAS